jgi:hypothetical protein
MREILLAKSYTIPEAGTFVDIDTDWIIIDGDQDTKILTENGDVLCHLKPKSIPNELTTLAVNSYLEAAKEGISNNRGLAAGAQHRNIKTNGKYESGLTVHSNIIGYMDSLNHKKPCRLTNFSKKHFEEYNAALPFIKHIDQLFKETMPKEYQLQHEAAFKSEYRIDDTVFSTVTINYNFRTAIHKDSGDFKGGFGTLAVCSENIEGGHILFPKYKLCIKLNTGDFLAMNVHEYHCNSQIHVNDLGLGLESGYRLSFVCYLRENMVKCEEINDIIMKLHGTLDIKHWETDIVFKDIFASELPVKKYSENNKWWTMSSGRFTLSYKNKRYQLYDSETNKTINNLMPAWKYAKSLV